MAALRLTRYWVEILFTASTPAIRRYFGITAYSWDDALALLYACPAYQADQGPQLGDIVIDVDVRTLDQGHVLPNMLPPSLRGVWFPMGYLS